MTIRLQLILLIFVLVTSCKSSSSNSESKDIGVQDDLRYEKAVVYSGVESQVPYVFFKKCPLDEPANRNCGNGASNFEKKLNLRLQYEPALPASDREKILSCLRGNYEFVWSVENDAPLPPIGSSRGCSLTKAQVQATFAPFGWPVGGGANTGGEASTLPQDMRFIPIAGTNFEMQETEVTRGQWKSVMGKYPEDPPVSDGVCNYPRNFVPSDFHPVSCVKWSEAVEFGLKISSSNDGTYRLPTVEEWVKAAGGIAGGTDGWCNRSSTRAVGLGTPLNGLYDMIGNVAEWTSDGNASNSTHATMGGSYDEINECSSGNSRRTVPSHVREEFIGFRLLKVRE